VILDKIIRNIYPSVVNISLKTDGVYSATDVMGNNVALDTSLINAEYDSQEYARSRKQEYDKLNQWEMQFDDNRDGTSTWVDSINEIKVRFPK
jgi:hypothetical protein